MTSRQPSLLANWLLQRCWPKARAEAIIGDLTEQYASGHSSAWYWRQTLAAMAMGCLTALRRHGASLAVALAAAWSVIFLWREANLLFVGAIHELNTFLRHGIAASAGLRELSENVDRRAVPLMTIWLLGASLRVAMFALSGWLAARLHAASPRIAVFALVVSVLAVRFPWLQLRIVDADFAWLIHVGTAVGGISIGALSSIFWRTPRESPARPR